jgi:hypothetical protein
MSFYRNARSLFSAAAFTNLKQTLMCQRPSKILGASQSAAPAKCIAAALSILLLSAAHASASSFSAYQGEDGGAGPGDPHPQSDFFEAAFAADTASLGGNVSLITFENAPVGSYTNLTIAPGVTLSGTNASGANQSILNAPDFPTAPFLDGFNTTPGGTNYAEIMGGTLTFTFASPIQSFGAYFTGIQTSFFQDVVEFSDGSPETVIVPGTGTTNSFGATDFVGITAPGVSITSITINSGNPTDGFDDIGIDDVQFQPVPEPACIALISIAGIAALGKRRRHAA